MRRILTCAIGASLVWLSLAAAQSKKSVAPAKTSAAKPGAAKATSAKTSTTRKGASASSKKSPARRPAVTWRNRQTVPSPDRYREIQSALAARGFLSPEEATGNWNASSSDALKRFQQEQNLEATGKVNSLSLIALGLGPKREAVVAVPKPQDPSSQPIRN
jgi:peptidoglycan hydrolase-like protein with peptidoglycan-binding domain